MANLDELQQKLNYKFKNVALLTQALTHKSYSKLNYERFEFVGDSILDYVVALNLYNQYPDLAEGELSKMRSALVNEATLVNIAQELELGKYLLLENGEEKSGGRFRASILADSVEAVFAAISFDSDFNRVKAVVEQVYAAKLTNAHSLILKDNKSILQEYLQERRLLPPKYDMVEMIGPDHNAVFKVACSIPELDIYITALGKTKKEASQLAAYEVLNVLKGKYVKLGN
ncbi:MAG: ribonuclease III [Burkholderiales bacterium]|nr:ribonuclease III [Burkholderiales bacterium]